MKSLPTLKNLLLSLTLSGLFGLIALTWPHQTFAALSNTPASTLTTDGNIKDITFGADGTMYWGGDFTAVGTNTGKVSKLSPTTGDVDTNFPIVLNTLDGNPGIVYSIISDGSNGWYIGGAFNYVGGEPIRSLAHINSDYSVDTSWNPDITDGQVRALALHDGVVYAGGTFHTVNGATTRNLAAGFSVADATVTSWNPNLGTFNQSVETMAVVNSKIYLGGTFTQVNGGTTRNNLAAFPVGSSTVTSWNPNAIAQVTEMAVNGNILYIAGNFTNVMSTTRNRIAAIDTSTDTLVTTWNPNANNYITGIALSDHNTLYAVGTFTSIGGQSRSRIAELSLVDGTATSWNPQPTTTITFVSITANSDTVFATTNSGGSVTIEGQARSVAVAFSEADGSITAWNPQLRGGTNYTAFYDAGTDSVLFGGAHYLANGVSRPYFAAINPTTDELLDWNPVFNGSVEDFELEGNTLYVGGYFWQIDGATRRYAAALDLTSQTLTAWDPNFSYAVHSLDISDHGTIYAGGAFGTVNGGTTRSYAAEVDKSTAVATDWNPNPNNYVNRILQGPSNTVYIGGQFWNLQGGATYRQYLAEVNVTTGAPTSWNPDPNDYIYDMVLSDHGTMYIAGEFWKVDDSVSGIIRNSLAEISLATDAPTSWAPDMGDYVYRIYPFGDNLYVGGLYETVNGTNQAYLAEISAADGSLSAWRPQQGKLVYAISSSGTSLFTGGTATRFNGLEVPNTTPNTPTLSSGTNLTGTTSNDSTPSFTFTLSDDDASDTVGFQIQIDSASDFSAPAVDYTSGTTNDQGEVTFTVGQPAGDGTYTEGEEGQTLPDEDYYVQVRTVDSNGGTSSYEQANEGDVAFTIDSVAPTVPGTPTSASTTSNPTPTWTWNASTDSSSGLADDAYVVSWCNNSSFTGCDAYTDTTSTTSFTHTTQLTEGTWYFQVKAVDNAGNSSANSSPASITLAFGSGISSGHRSSSSSRSSGTSCSAQKPQGTPQLFEIRTTNTTAQVFFSPVAQVDEYFISYGTTESADQYGVWIHGSKEGVNSFTLQALAPGQEYFVKVLPQRDCASGDWGNTMQISTQTTDTSRTFYAFVPYVRQVVRQVVAPQRAIPTEAKTLEDTEPELQAPLPEPEVQNQVPSPRPTLAPQTPSSAEPAVPSPEPQQPWWKKIFSWF